MEAISQDISVIIPVYNEESGLRDTLESLEEQDVEDQKYEVIVVDNNSTDGTSNVIREFSDRNSNFKGLEETNIQSSYAARNKGIEASNGEIICFLDADMWADPDYLRRIKDFFSNNQEIDYIGCNVEIIDNSGTITGKYNQLNGFPVEKYMREKKFAPTCCLSVRKEVFSNIGLFNPKLISGGDKLFGKKVDQSGFKMHYVDEISLYHPARTYWREIASKYFRMGRGWFQKEIFTETEFEDEEVRAIDVLATLRKILSNLIIDFQDRKLSFREVTAFMFLNSIKKISMFSGYNYQRFNTLIDKNMSSS